jgi:hypothetical protein
MHMALRLIAADPGEGLLTRKHTASAYIKEGIAASFGMLDALAPDSSPSR